MFCTAYKVQHTVWLWVGFLASSNVLLYQKQTLLCALLCQHMFNVLRGLQSTAHSLVMGGLSGLIQRGVAPKADLVVCSPVSAHAQCSARLKSTAHSLVVGVIASFNMVLY